MPTTWNVAAGYPRGFGRAVRLVGPSHTLPDRYRAHGLFLAEPLTTRAGTRVVSIPTLRQLASGARACQRPERRACVPRSAIGSNGPPTPRTSGARSERRWSEVLDSIAEQRAILRDLFREHDTSSAVARLNRLTGPARPTPVREVCVVVRLDSGVRAEDFVDSLTLQDHRPTEALIAGGDPAEAQRAVNELEWVGITAKALPERPDDAGLLRWAADRATRRMVVGMVAAPRSREHLPARCPRGRGDDAGGRGRQGARGERPVRAGSRGQGRDRRPGVGPDTARSGRWLARGMVSAWRRPLRARRRARHALMALPPLRSALVYGEVDLGLIDGSAVWVTSVVEALVRAGCDVTLQLKAAPRPGSPLLETLRAQRAVRLVDPPAGRLKATGRSALTPKEAATTLHALDGHENFDLVVIRGFRVATLLARDPAFSGRLWTYLTDIPQSVVDLDSGDRGQSDRDRRVVAIAPMPDRGPALVPRVDRPCGRRANGAAAPDGALGRERRRSPGASRPPCSARLCRQVRAALEDARDDRPSGPAGGTWHRCRAARRRRQDPRRSTRRDVLRPDGRGPAYGPRCRLARRCDPRNRHAGLGRRRHRPRLARCRARREPRAVDEDPRIRRARPAGRAQSNADARTAARRRLSALRLERG